MASCVMEFTRYVAADGLIYEFDDDERLLMSEEGMGLPPINYLMQRGPHQDGETILDYRLGTRLFQLIVRQDSCDRYTYWEKRELLLNALRPNRHPLNTMNIGYLERLFPNGNIRRIDCIIQEGPGFVGRQEGRWDEWGFTETLRFLAPNPTFYDPSEVCVVFSTAVEEEQLIFPIVFRNPVHNPSGTGIIFGTSLAYEQGTITYAGNWKTLPILRIVGPIKGPEIHNVTLGEKIRLNYTVSAGEYVDIDLRYNSKNVVNSLGVNLNGVLSDDSVLATFRLEPHPIAPGGVNTILFSGYEITPGTTQLEVYYLNRYIGI